MPFHLYLYVYMYFDTIINMTGIIEGFLVMTLRIAVWRVTKFIGAGDICNLR